MITEEVRKKKRDVQIERYKNPEERKRTGEAVKKAFMDNYDKINQDRICVICGKIFKGRTNAQYCSPECRKLGQWTNTQLFYETHRIDPLAYNRESYKKHREERLKHSKEYRNEHLKECQDRDNKRREYKRKNLYHIIGDTCIVCGSKEDINFHEIHGKEHITHLKYYFDHKEDFIPMCRWCHLSSHIFIKMIKLNVDMTKFFEIVDRMLS